MKYKHITKGRGDAGFTDLCLGGRVLKTDSRIETVGDIDEFHASIGLCHPLPHDSHSDMLLHIQKDLTLLMGELSTSDDKKSNYIEKFGGISDKSVDFIEKKFLELAIQLDNERGEQTEWALYGERGHKSAKFDYAGTVCRRCERRIIGLVKNGYSVRNEILTYMNRLGKLLYLLARFYDEI